MEFIEHLKAFDKMKAENLTPNAIAIYFHLFMVNNKTGWKEWFTESDLWIERSCGISRRETVIKALNLLKQKGFIDFERGTRKGKPTKYKILPLLNSAYDSSYDSACDSVKDSGKDSVRGSDIPRHKTKTKDNRQVNNNKARTKFVPPTLEEVNQYIMENHLHVSAKDFVDYFTDMGWVDSKGQKVISWKGKIRTWEKYQSKQSNKKTTHEDSMDAADRAIAFFEGGNTDDQGSGDCETFETVPFGVSKCNDAG